MQQTAIILLSIGGFLIMGMATDYLGRRTFLPRVTLLMVFGILIGPEVLDIVPDTIIKQFELVANMTLLMVGFLLGGKLTRRLLMQGGRRLLLISICAAVITTLVVTAGLYIAGLTPELALLLGCIASATAPAATADVVDEAGLQGSFSDLLLSIVAIDDAWGLIIFSLGISAVAYMGGLGESTSHIYTALYEIGGAILLGVLIGVPSAYLTGRVKPGKPMLTEALGLMFICGGLAIWLEVSYLIAAMVMGAIVSNFARHHEHAFHEIRHIEWSFMIIFFVLAGAMFEFSSLKHVGLVAVVYVFCRVIGKILGAGTGAMLSGADAPIRNWMGVALLPQAGVAMGMALVASSQFPEYRQILLSVIISTTILFELAGPVFTRMALNRANRQ